MIILDNCWQFVITLNKHLPYNLTILFLGIYLPKRNKNRSLQKDLETTQLSINRMNKLVYSHAMGIKSNQLVIGMATWMSVKNILSQRS